jgi:hypothetical protein
VSTVRSPHDRIVTPDTDPDRFSEEEADAFRRGVCGQTGYGYWGTEICGRPSKRGASFGNCDEHDAGMLVDHWPDGADRQYDDPWYQERPDYQQRLQESLEAHQRYCTDPDCECRS